MDRYSRNRIYLSQEDQQRIGQFRILLGGLGIGSVIAECALRMGFEHITLIDGDEVELSNLNRQNYTTQDLNTPKAEALQKRLLDIHPGAIIKVHHTYLNETNLEDLAQEHDVAVNALDFTSDVPFLFDRYCSRRGMHVLHPYNIGWAGLLTVLHPHGPALAPAGTAFEGFELQVVQQALDQLEATGQMPAWITNVLQRYQEEHPRQSPPQLAIASYLLAAQCTRVLYQLALSKPVKVYPHMYWIPAEI